MPLALLNSCGKVSPVTTPTKEDACQIEQWPQIPHIEPHFCKLDEGSQVCLSLEDSLEIGVYTRAMERIRATLRFCDKVKEIK